MFIVQNPPVFVKTHWLQRGGYNLAFQHLDQETLFFLFIASQKYKWPPTMRLPDGPTWVSRFIGG